MWFFSVYLVISLTRMEKYFISTILLLFNIFGVVNLWFNREKKCFEARNVFIVSSTVLFLLMQTNTYLIFYSLYWMNDKDNLLFLLGWGDLFSWVSFDLGFLLEGIIQRHRYAKLVNVILSTEKDCLSTFVDFSKFRQNLRKNIRAMLIFQVVFQTFYATFKVFKEQAIYTTLLAWFQQMVYSQALFFPLLSNLVVELTFVQSCNMFFKVVTHNVQVGGVNQLRRNLSLFDSFFSIATKLSNICQFGKLFQAHFVLISTTVYAFYVYYGFFNPLYRDFELYFWISLTLLVAGSWYFWGQITREVSVLRFIS